MTFIQIMIALLVGIDILVSLARLREDRRKRTSIEWLNEELTEIGEEVRRKVRELHAFSIHGVRPTPKPVPTGVPPGPRRST